jgi:hypothetical protein
MELPEVAVAQCAAGSRVRFVLVRAKVGVGRKSAHKVGNEDQCYLLLAPI